MLELAIDTSYEYLSLSLKTHTGFLNFHQPVGPKQTEFILPEINNLLSQAGKIPPDLTKIIYNMGPGSFTGLRIGLSIAKGLAYALNIPLVPIPGFFTYTNPSTLIKPNLLVLLDARLNQCYLALFKPASLEYLIPPQLCNPEEVVELIKKNNLSLNACVGAGSGFMAYAKKLNLPEGFEIITQIPPSAQVLHDLSFKFKPQNSKEAGLLYLRNKVALTQDELKNASA